MKQGRSEVDLEKRRKTYQELYRLAHDEAMWLFVHAQDELWAKRRDVPWTAVQHHGQQGDRVLLPGARCPLTGGGSARVERRRDDTPAPVYYDRLKEAILTGTLRPLERISENKIAADFGLSRTPVREALQRLGVEGLIQVVPKRGSFVSRPTVEDILEIYQIRTPLEATCARVAAEADRRGPARAARPAGARRAGARPARSPDRSLRCGRPVPRDLYRLLAQPANGHPAHGHAEPGAPGTGALAVHGGSAQRHLGRSTPGSSTRCAPTTGPTRARLMIEHLEKARLSTLNRILPSTGI